MKKILALVLVVSCVFALGSCKLFKKNKNKTDEAPVINAADVSSVQAKVDASVPETATVTVEYKSSLGTLNSTYTVTYNEDGTATVVYTYEKFNSLDSDEYKSAFSGTTTINADGTLTTPPAGVAAVEALSFDLNLDPAKLYSADLTAGVLSAVVKAENTAAVLGVALGVDAKLVVTVGSLGVGSVAVSYVTSDGEVEIISTYTYHVEEEEDEEDGDSDSGDEENA